MPPSGVGRGGGGRSCPTLRSPTRCRAKHRTRARTSRQGAGAAAGSTRSRPLAPLTESRGRLAQAARGPQQGHGLFLSPSHVRIECNDRLLTRIVALCKHSERVLVNNQRCSTLVLSTCAAQQQTRCSTGLMSGRRSEAAKWEWPVGKSCCVENTRASHELL